MGTYEYEKAALDGLVMLSNDLVREDRSLIQGGYFRAVELLFDAEVPVRCSAVHVVGELGRLICSLSPEDSKREWSDALFVQLSLMVRDMKMEIRVAAFCELEKTPTVSSDILLQTLSKKCFPGIKDRTFHGQYTDKLLKLPASTAAYAFVHGLEDEFYQVRKSACHAMQMLSILSAEFAAQALDILIDMVNDDSLEVRVQCLETLHHIYLHNRFKMEETHLEMLCVTLVDSDTLVRSAVREVFRLCKLPKFEMFYTCINSFVENLELYPLDEADVINTLYKMGRNHGRFVSRIIQDSSEEIEPSFDGTLRLTKLRTVALLVLAVSAPVSFDRRLSSIPPQLFSYAVTLLDRISNGLRDVAEETSILVYLSHCSKFNLASASENFEREALCFPMDGRHSDSSQGSHDIDELVELEKGASDLPIKTASLTDLILQKAVSLWQFLKLGLADEVLRTLRSFKEELRNYSHGAHHQSAGVIFTLNFLNVIKWLAKGSRWHFSRSTFHSEATGTLIALSKLETKLEEMLHRFSGLRIADNLHLVELMLVTCVLRLSQGFNCSYGSMKKLKSLLHLAEELIEHESVEPPKFVIELRDISNNDEDILIDKLPQLRNSLNLFYLKPFSIPEELRHLNAAIEVAENDFHRPLPFFPCLPVGIPLEVSIYNIPLGTRIWVVASTGSSRKQFIYLDLNGCKGCNEVKKCSFVAPILCTPSVKRFSVKVSIAMEGSAEAPKMKSACFGPKRKLVYLCKEKEVYLCREIVESNGNK